MNSLNVVPDTYEFDSQLLAIERKVDAAEGDGLRARWEFGKVMLDMRVGKLLPRGVLNQKAALIGKSRTEVKYRMLFAERFRTERQLVNAVDQFKSWHDVVKIALARADEDADDDEGEGGGGSTEPDFSRDAAFAVLEACRTICNRDPILVSEFIASSPEQGDMLHQIQLAQEALVELLAEVGNQ